MINITDEGSLLISVNRHNNKFDGTICTKPASYNKCGAQEYFRKNYCAKGISDCMDMRLFAEVGSACINKRIRDEERKVFDNLVNLIAAGYNPIVFFYTSKQQGSKKSFYIVGCYVVKEVQIIPIDYEKCEVQIFPERFIRLPMDVMSNEGLWSESTPSESNLFWVRNVYKAAVVQALEEILLILERSEASEYANFASKLEEVIGYFSDGAISGNVGSEDIIEKHTISDTEPIGGSLQQHQTVEIVPEQSVTVKREVKNNFELQVNQIRRVASEQGFYYSEKVVRTICSNMVVNPLLVLSGISGSGKSSFATFYAKAVNGELAVISVRPDWTNPTHLLGMYNPFVKDFVPTPVTEFIRKAQAEWESSKKEKREARPFILVLDEMNLARVEYYFSDFLSKMQMPDEKMRVLQLYSEKEGSYPSKLLLTDNLKIIGTVNVDETTFLFSPKVLDRAGYINLNEIDITGMGEILEKRAVELHNLNLIREYVIPELRDLNYKLAEFDQPFGYRTVWDIIRWIDYSLTVENIATVHEGIDYQVESRILVKLTDSRKALLFTSLKSYFEDRNSRQSLAQPIYERCLQRLEVLINRSMRDEYAIGQQY